MTGGPPGDKKVWVMGVPIQVGKNPGVGAQRIVRLQLTTTRQGKQFNLDTEGSIYFNIFLQCCGSGSGIRCLFDPWILDLG
jgi:hypothetical protein